MSTIIKRIVLFTQKGSHGSPSKYVPGSVTCTMLQKHDSINCTFQLALTEWWWTEIISVVYQEPRTQEVAVKCLVWWTISKWYKILTTVALYI